MYLTEASVTPEAGYVYSIYQNTFVVPLPRSYYLHLVIFIIWEVLLVMAYGLLSSQGGLLRGRGIRGLGEAIAPPPLTLKMLCFIPYLHLAWPGLRQNYPRQFGHGRASLPIYTDSANHALLAKYPIYIYPDQAFAKFYLEFTHRTYEQKSSLGEGVCLHLTLAEILAETVFARLTSLAKLKLAQCKQNFARPWPGCKCK